MKIPIIKAMKLWHIGNEEINESKARKNSFEGRFLSVSACPEAWISIAKLGGGTVHATNRVVRLLDMHAIYEPFFKICLKEISDYGYKRGFIEDAIVYRLEEENESGEEVFTLYRTYEEALNECLDESDIEQVSMQISTPKLLKRNRINQESIISGLDLCIAEWADESLGDLVDGVYWSEKYDKYALSAPRGALFKRALKLLSINSSIPSDSDGLKGITDGYAMNRDYGSSLIMPR